MPKFLSLLPLLFLIPQMDSRLLGRWEMIMEEGIKKTDKNEILFLADYSFEVSYNDKTKKGHWRVLTGKEKTILILRSEDNEKEDILNIRFSSDSLILTIEEDEIVFLKAR